MDYEQFFPKQTTLECANEKFALGLLAIVSTVYILVDCISMCRSNRKMNDIQHQNETLKEIILKSMELGLIRLMQHSAEDDHED